MSVTTAAAQQPASSAAAAPATPTAGKTGADALGSLSGNFQDFLTLLMTQLKNQDPSSPTDPNQFTSELVQFSSVEQQISTNSNLTKLIELTQGSEVIQSSALVGRQVEVASDHLSLQNGAAGVRFTAPAAEPVTVGVYADNGKLLQQATVQAAKGSNDWRWDGTNASGAAMPDGSYRVVVSGQDGSGSAGALPFTVTGTATGVRNGGTAVQLQLGALAVDFSAVKSVTR